MSSSYRMSLDAWLSNLEVVAENCLDIGGSQQTVKGRTKSWKVDNYKIADLEDPHKGEQPDIIFDLQGNNLPVFEEFDLIFCLEVFEYIYDPVRAFKNIHALLSPGGCAWVSFPFVYPLHEPVMEDSLRYTDTAIFRLAERTKLAVDTIIPRRPESKALLDFYSQERLRAAKGVDHNIFGWIVRLSK